MMQDFERSISQAGTRIVDRVVNFLPGALVLLVLLVSSLVLAWAFRHAVLRALRSLEFDRRAEPFGLPLAAWTPSGSASQFVASAVYWTILTLGILLGLTALDAPLPSRFAISVLEYVPHLAAACVILVIGGVLARFLARAVLIGAVNMQLHFARVLSLAVKWVILIVAGAMALDHIGIGRTVLLLAFGILFGGVVFALALAVGLGSKDIVSRALQRQIREPADRDRMNHV